MNENTKPIGISLPKRTIDAIDRLARRYRWSRSQTVQLIWEFYENVSNMGDELACMKRFMNSLGEPGLVWPEGELARHACNVVAASGGNPDYPEEVYHAMLDRLENVAISGLLEPDIEDEIY